MDPHEYRHFVEFLWSWHTRRKILSIDMIVIMPSPFQRLFQYRVTVTLPKALVTWKGMVWRRGLGGSSQTWSNSQQEPPYTQYKLRVKKNPSARQQCWPENFCKSGKFLRQVHYWLKNFRILCNTKYPDNMQSVWMNWKVSGQSK